MHVVEEDEGERGGGDDEPEEDGLEKRTVADGGDGFAIKRGADEEESDGETEAAGVSQGLENARSQGKSCVESRSEAEEKNEQR